jgi:hypothetical protein
MKYSRLMCYIITIYIIHQNKRLMPDFSVAAGLLPCSLSVFLRLGKTKEADTTDIRFFHLFILLSVHSTHHRFSQACRKLPGGAGWPAAFLIQRTLSLEENTHKTEAQWHSLYLFYGES